MKVVEPESLLETTGSYPLFFQRNYGVYESKRGWRVLLIASDDNTVIPLKIRSAKFIKQGQYLYPPLKEGKRLTIQDELIFLKNLLSFCRQNHLCDFIAPPLHFSLFDVVPSHSYFTGLGIIVVDITRSDDELFKAFSANYKNEIRKALAAEVGIKSGNEWFDHFYALYKSTHVRQHVYYESEEEMRNLVQYLGKEHCRIFVAVHGDEIYGAALVLWSGTEAYYYSAGSVDRCPVPGANKVLQLEIMKWLKTVGVKRYSMGGYRLGAIQGTKYEGMQNFKMRFGAQLEKGYHFYSKVTWKYPVYKILLKWYLRLRGVKQNMTGLNYKYN